MLFAVQVDGVPTLYVEEALWTRRAALERSEASVESCLPERRRAPGVSVSSSGR